ncbi:MAG: hypothetical protein U5K29_00760 [Acidimicrobiales bacterium]|nr:hypothetical protein [Acidimicrobiales bacterium]
MLGALFTVLALSLIACSDDDAADPAADAPESPAADASESPDPDEVDSSESGPAERDDSDVEADRQIAERAVLRLDDFPPGWQEQVQQDEDDEALQAGIAECAGYDFEELYGGGERAASPTFVSSQDEEITSSVTVFPTEEAASRRYDAKTAPATIDCVGDAMRSVLRLEGAGEGIEVLNVEINRLSTSALGDQTYGFRVTLELRAQGMTLPVYLDVVGVRVGRVGASVTAMSTFSPYFTSDLEGYVETVVSRIDLD